MVRLMFPERPLALALIALAASPPAALAASDVSIIDAKIAGGKLVISGSTAPNTWVRLDGQAETAFNAKSGPDGTFEFGILYHPGDCIIDVQRLISPAKLGAAAQALVFGCAPRSLTGRGAWDGAAQYFAEDVVVAANGTGWRAT